MNVVEQERLVSGHLHVRAGHKGGALTPSIRMSVKSSANLSQTHSLLTPKLCHPLVFAFVETPLFRLLLEGSRLLKFNLFLDKIMRSA